MQGARIIVVVIILSISSCYGNIHQCNSEENVESNVCTLVHPKHIFDAPIPRPVDIDITISFEDVTELDEEKETVTLSLRITLEWNDTRLSLNRTKEDIDKYYFNKVVLQSHTCIKLAF